MRAVFLDRDGVINEDEWPTTEWSKFKLNDGAIEAVRKLNETGMKVIVVTNQPVIARNLCTEKDIENLHVRMVEEFKANGAKIDAGYFCPHHPETHHKDGNQTYRIECDCRKPKTGMIEKAVRDFGIELKGSYLVGDSTRETEMGRKLKQQHGKFTTILVKTGYGGTDGNYDAQADYTCNDISDAADKILELEEGNV